MNKHEIALWLQNAMVGKKTVLKGSKVKEDLEFEYLAFCYVEVSDVAENHVQFASQILTPRRMH